MRDKPIRVLIADDSRTVRNTLATILREADAVPYIDVVGQASDGIEALSAAQALNPDVITMDVQMPRMNGVEAIAEIMEAAPTRILVICSMSEHDVDLSFRAMAVGALEVIAKPGRGEDLSAWGKRVVDSVKLMAEIPVVTRRRLRRVAVRTGSGRSGTVDVFGIGASTGGPAALAQILGALPADFQTPILIAQHMTPGFTGGLVRWFSEVTPLKMVLAANDMIGMPGHVYFPPDSHDLEVDEEGVMKVIYRSDHAPSANRLLSSIARAYGARAAGILLTGMGADGAEGLLAIRKAGGVTLAQDQESCVVFGMPHAAFQLGAVTDLLPPEGLIRAMLELSQRSGAIAAAGGENSRERH